GGSDKGVRGLLQLVDDLIHGLGDLVRPVPRQVLREGLGVELAARLPLPASMAFGSSKDLVWQGDSRFHTPSITTTASRATPVAWTCAAPPPVSRGCAAAARSSGARHLAPARLGPGKPRAAVDQR